MITKSFVLVFSENNMGLFRNARRIIGKYTNENGSSIGNVMGVMSQYLEDHEKTPCITLEFRDGVFARCGWNDRWVGVGHANGWCNPDLDDSGIIDLTQETLGGEANERFCDLLDILQTGESNLPQKSRVLRNQYHSQVLPLP